MLLKKIYKDVNSIYCNEPTRIDGYTPDRIMTQILNENLPNLIELYKRRILDRKKCSIYSIYNSAIALRLKLYDGTNPKDVWDKITCKGQEEDCFYTTKQLDYNYLPTNETEKFVIFCLTYYLLISSSFEIDKAKEKYKGIEELLNGINALSERKLFDPFKSLLGEHHGENGKFDDEFVAGKHEDLTMIPESDNLYLEQDIEDFDRIKNGNKEYGLSTIKQATSILYHFSIGCLKGSSNKSQIARLASWMTGGSESYARDHLKNERITREDYKTITERCKGLFTPEQMSDFEKIIEKDPKKD